MILIKGLTPIPYKIVTIASGAAKFDFSVFMAASAVTRGARFFMVAALLRFFGTPMRDFIERRLTLGHQPVRGRPGRRLLGAEAALTLQLDLNGMISPQSGAETARYSGSGET